MCVFSSKDAGTIIASGAMIANKARTDYDPILAPCMADIVEKRRKAGGRAPVTTKLEPALCKDMQRDAGGGWGNFLDIRVLEEHIQIGKNVTQNATNE